MSDPVILSCVIQIIPENVLRKNNPIISGVKVLDGFLKIGTQIIVPDKKIPEWKNPEKEKTLSLGKVVSIEYNHKSIDLATQGMEVFIKIQGKDEETVVQFGRDFNHTNILYSQNT